MTHVNSIVTYQQEAAKFNDRELLIYGYLMQHGPKTDRQTRDGLFGLSRDLNSVRPRVTDLKKRGWVKEVDQVKDKVTGKTVRVVEAVSAEVRLAKMQQVEMVLTA